MAKITYQTSSCPSCGATLEISMPGSAYLYGSPIRQCPSCGNSYWDQNYHEIAVEGIREADVTVKNFGQNLFGSLVATVICGGLLGFFLNRGRLHIGLLIVTAFFALFFVYTIVNAIKIKSGSKQKELERERQESIRRLQDREYAWMLKNIGYPVPEQYL
ncbi:MAG: hypothetical protein IJ960_09720 [Oscillospiraceae bacterium]|nr:hypothetical protein [Oscillospiraceae bacterium]